MVVAMYTNCGSSDISIEDLARLARETCVYRGSSQSLKKLAATEHRRPTDGHMQRLLSLFKRK
jgi:hypothetical protein